MVSEAMLSESILSLASAIAEKDVTSQGNGTKAKALEVLGNVLEAKGVQQLEGDDAIYALSQYAQRKSSDTVVAALGVGECASGGGGGTAHSITCKIINNDETGELLDMPNCVGMASIQNGTWGSDNPYVPPENPVEEAVGGTILYAHSYIADESTTYNPIGLGTPYADAFGGVALVGSNVSVTSFAMPNDDVIVLYVPYDDGGGSPIPK